ncbi:hypothetical protein OPT61_g9686 [Boeremia exigua]|uniref:Uncharacterized protein n=1 Tax=Boeremia exigua TaxID=749465 RepID=A0ACC2HTU6_9PLEO|nr:hypothetical protein OPT61_g9686 [Boeremia exigua]
METCFAVAGVGNLEPHRSAANVVLSLSAHQSWFGRVSTERKPSARTRRSRTQLNPDGARWVKKAEQHRHPAGCRDAIRRNTQYDQAAFLDVTSGGVIWRCAARRAGRRSAFVRHVAMPRIEQTGKAQLLWQ